MLGNSEHGCVMRWNLQGLCDAESDPRRAEFAYLSVGTLADGGWYVDHTGFGTRRFADKHAAWAAVRRLMSLHEGEWEQVRPDAEVQHQPITADGWRVLYNASGLALYNSWGELRERIWERYKQAISKGRKLGDTKRHWTLDGHIFLMRYIDPLDRSVRYAVDDLIGDWEYGKRHIADHHDRTEAEIRYRQVVREAAHKGSRFPWSDVPGVPIHLAKPDRFYRC